MDVLKQNVLQSRKKKKRQINSNMDVLKPKKDSGQSEDTERLIVTWMY